MAKSSMGTGASGFRSDTNSDFHTAVEVDHRGILMGGSKW